MSIKIHTYSNPYQIMTYPLKEEIRDCIQFCASQTMVNGLMSVYGGDQPDSLLHYGQLYPVSKLVECLFEEWDGNGRKIRQFNEVDSALKTVIMTSDSLELVNNSLDLNAQSYTEAIRLLFELGIKNEDLNGSRDELTIDQRYLIEAFKKLEGNPAFHIQETFEREAIDDAIGHLQDEQEEKKISYPFVYHPDQPIVFHGIHQFTPMILRTIEAVSRYKDVILLFNYNPIYRKTFETWMTVYENFGLPITAPENSRPEGVHPAPIKINESHMLGEQLASMLEGFLPKSAKIPLKSIKFTAFANTTEFARYVSNEYEKALARCKYYEGEKKPPILSFMEEQFYAADSSVNKILKIYHPEQFGEQRFLNYPVGRFFVAIAHMWDSSRGTAVIADLSDIYDCLHSGIIMDDREGKLAETFLQCRDYLGSTDAMELGIIRDRIRSLSRSVSGLKLKKHPEYRQISYFLLRKEDLEQLTKGLDQLGMIAKLFFEDFDENQVTFRQFYARVADFLNKKVETIADLDSEFRTVMERMLIRLKSIDFPELKPSFSCLRKTMTYYLDQEDQRGARWIVRNFEQIDGDILRSKVQKLSGQHVIYHFCCLSDDNMSVSGMEIFPWPLNEKFFDAFCNVNSTRFRIYLASRKERRNFKRYALIAGLLNNQMDVRISYIRNQKEHRTEPYYLLKLLGIPIEEYTLQSTSGRPVPRTAVSPSAENQRTNFSTEDRLRYAICPYKFAIDSLIDRGTVFKDHFMVKKFLGVLLAERVGDALSWNIDSDVLVADQLRTQSEMLRGDFGYINDSEWLDVVGNARNNLRYKNETGINDLKQFIDSMLARQAFKDAVKSMETEEFAIAFEHSVTTSASFRRRPSGVCNTCVDREICMKSGAKRNE